MRNLTINTSADGFGRWRAEVIFPFELSESDPRKQFNLNYQMDGVRRQVRTELVRQITLRDQKTGESFIAAATRVRASLPRLKVLKQNICSVNLWHGITLGE